MARKIEQIKELIKKEKFNMLDDSDIEILANQGHSPAERFISLKEAATAAGQCYMAKHPKATLLHANQEIANKLIHLRPNINSAASFHQEPATKENYFQLLDFLNTQLEKIKDDNKSGGLSHQLTRMLLMSQSIFLEDNPVINFNNGAITMADLIDLTKNPPRVCVVKNFIEEGNEGYFQELRDGDFKNLSTKDLQKIAGRGSNVESRFVNLENAIEAAAKRYLERYLEKEKVPAANKIEKYSENISHFFKTVSKQAHTRHDDAKELLNIIKTSREGRAHNDARHLKLISILANARAHLLPTGKLGETVEAILRSNLELYIPDIAHKSTAQAVGILQDRYPRTDTLMPPNVKEAKMEDVAMQEAKQKPPQINH